MARAMPDEARACIHLPAFDALELEKAERISGHYPQAEAEYRNLRGKERSADALEIPHFERVFRIAAAIAGQRNVESAREYDDLLILTAWHCVRPEVEGYLGSYPKALLCPFSHAAPPTALDTLSKARRYLFDRRASVYLRYLLCNKYGLRTCADIENADLRQLLKSTGFRLIYPSAVPEFAFAGITRGEDPPVRPWKLTLRQELTDERAGEMLINAALWQIKHGLRLVTLEQGQPRWNIGAFERTDWEDAFLSLGVRIAPSLMRAKRSSSETGRRLASSSARRRWLRSEARWRASRSFSTTRKRSPASTTPPRPSTSTGTEGPAVVRPAPR